MGSAETATDLESPQRYCCHRICYFYVAKCLDTTDADCLDFADFMVRYKGLQKSADFVEFAYVPRGYDYRNMQEQRYRCKTLGSPVTTAVMTCAMGRSAFGCRSRRQSSYSASF